MTSRARRGRDLVLNLQRQQQAAASQPATGSAAASDTFGHALKRRRTAATVAAPSPATTTADVADGGRRAREARDTSGAGPSAVAMAKIKAAADGGIKTKTETEAAAEFAATDAALVQCAEKAALRTRLRGFLAKNWQEQDAENDQAEACNRAPDDLVAEDPTATPAPSPSAKAFQNGFDDEWKRQRAKTERGFAAAQAEFEETLQEENRREQVARGAWEFRMQRLVKQADKLKKTLESVKDEIVECDQQLTRFHADGDALRQEFSQDELEQLFSSVLQAARAVRQEKDVRITEQLAAKSDVVDCILCRERPKEVLYMPCHHLSVCWDCHGRLHKPERAALDQYRTDSLAAGLAVDQERVHRALVGEEAFAKVPLEKLRDHTATRSAEKRINQLKQRVEDLEANKSKHVYRRIDVEIELEKEKNHCVRVADKKRALEARFGRLLNAYQELIGAYQSLQKRYVRVKAMKQMTTVDRVKHSLRKVKELFTQEDAHDPDALPSIGRVEEHKETADDLLSLVSAGCEICGQGGKCPRGFRRTPFSETICECGHEKEFHDFDNPMPT
ncbi:E3 ubiquitin-protein ligase RNF26 [Durusdinium trenchii]|uniref:E3 ubiquitin-protein ligase RNF26 n=1 Tax=Durusdinium trenchii TaxID=1381693 RepID=A0ABP0SQD2_9DINO